MKCLRKAAEKYHAAEIGRMFAILGKRKALFIFCLAGCCVSPVAFRIVSALLYKTMIDAAVLADLSILRNACILAGVVLLSGCVLDPWFGYRYAKCIRRSMLDIRRTLFEKLTALPLAYFEKNHSGDTLARMTNDLNAMESAYGKQISSLLVVAGMGVSAAVTMLALDWRFALPVFLLGFIFMRVNLAFMFPSRRLSDEIQERKGLAFQFLNDILAGIRVLRVFNVRAVFGRFHEEIDAVKDVTMKRSKIFGVQMMANHVISTACYVGTLIVGAFLADAKKSDFGTILAIMTLQQSFNYMLTALGEYFASLQESLAGTARVFQLLDAREEIASGIASRTGPGSRAAAVEFRSVAFRYEEQKPVLSDLSFRVPEGSFAAIVGESGCGKSSIMKLLLRFYGIDSGEILLAGWNLASMMTEDIRKGIAYVPQDSYLFDGTIEENIRFGRPGATDAEVVRAAKAAFADGFIRGLKDGYDTKVGERGFKLSGGQRQRIGIARALLKGAPLLILDEATSALDSESEILVRDAIAALMRGRTTLAVAHRFSTIEHADEIFVLKDGRIVESGRHETLMERGGAYRALRECRQEN